MVCSCVLPICKAACLRQNARIDDEPAKHENNNNIPLFVENAPFAQNIELNYITILRQPYNSQTATRHTDAERRSLSVQRRSFRSFSVTLHLTRRGKFLPRRDSVVQQGQEPVRHINCSSDINNHAVRIENFNANCCFTRADQYREHDVHVSTSSRANTATCTAASTHIYCISNCQTNNDITRADQSQE